MSETSALNAPHQAWLKSHPKRNKEWLKKQMADGFLIHHMDGDDQNNDPLNLILLEGVDHRRLHNRKLKWGFRAWRDQPSKSSRGARVKAWRAKNREHYNAYMRSLRAKLRKEREI